MNCGDHNFSTDDFDEWYEHLEKFEHTYDLQTDCRCGKRIHVRPKTKLPAKLLGIPIGYMCDECKKHIQDTPEVKKEKVVTP